MKKRENCRCQKNSCQVDRVRSQTNRTAYIDAKFGNDATAELENENKQFRTFNSAVQAVAEKGPSERFNWNLKVAPGIYQEVVTLPGFINLLGVPGVVIEILFLEGAAVVENVTLIGPELPLLFTSLNNPTEAENQVTLNNITVVRKEVTNTELGALVRIAGDGINNQVTVNDSQFLLQVNADAEITSPQTLFNVESILQLNNVKAELSANPMTTSTLLNVSGQANVNGGLFRHVIINEPPANESSVFNVANTAGLSVNNNIATFAVLALQGMYTENLIYVNAGNAALVNVLDSTAFLDGISADFLVLAQANSNASVELLNLKTPGIVVPRIIEAENNIVKYVAFSGNGSALLSGNLHTGIKEVNSVDFPNNYLLQPGDSTILSLDVNVSLYLPEFASNQVQEIGKIITVKNTGSDPIEINGQTIGTIFDAEVINLAPLASVVLQNDGKVWFIVASHGDVTYN